MAIYLNNAATTWPKPEPVVKAVLEFMTEGGANLSRGSASKRDLLSLDDVFRCREKVASLFNGYGGNDPAYVTFTSNVTESLNTVIKGTLRDGMKAVTSTMEHNSVIRPLRRAESEGVKVEAVKCSLKGYLDPKSFELALDGADLAVISHSSNVSGSLQNLEAIAEVCRAKKVPLVLDSAQTAGLVQIDAAGLGLAALCFTGHKSLYAPQGIGGIVWNPDFAERCKPLSDGGTGSRSHEEVQPGTLPDKFEAGTPNMPGIAGLLAALEWLENETLEKVAGKEAELGLMLEEGLRKIKGLRLLGPAEGDPRTHVYSFNIDGLDNASIALRLADRYGIESRPGLHCSPLAHRTLGSFPEGALRLSPGYFNTEDEIEAAIEALNEIARAVRR